MSKNRNTLILNEFVLLIGYHQKYAIRILGAKPVKQVTIYTNGGSIIIKPEKKQRPVNRKGKRVYTEEVINVLRIIWIFFHFKCGKILAPLYESADEIYFPMEGVRRH